jgi:hypothetical protein
MKAAGAFNGLNGCFGGWFLGHQSKSIANHATNIAPTAPAATTIWVKGSGILGLQTLAGRSRINHNYASTLRPI